MNLEYLKELTHSTAPSPAFEGGVLMTPTGAYCPVGSMHRHGC